MDTQNLLIALLFYSLLEGIFRISVLAHFVGWRYASWRLASPHMSMFISPGYWLAKNCKKVDPPGLRRIALRARLIANYNIWNLLLSVIVFAAVLATDIQGYVPYRITVALIFWRAVSRSFEIAIAFGNDITESLNASRLSNGARMKLALRSYFEIFFFSAALYAVSSDKLAGLYQSMLASLYVGTLTNVPYAAERLPFPHLVFLQVFATLSLIVLSIAGYLGKIKRTK